MRLTADPQLLRLFGGILAVLVVSSAVGWVLRRRVSSESGRATVANLNARIGAWWAMAAVVALAVLSGPLGAVILFGLLSLLALREFVTLATTRRGDHRALFYGFFVLLPLQYALVYFRWYGLFAILIPVYGFLYVSARSALAGDTSQFLERIAEIQWALMISVYCVSHAPALLMLRIEGRAAGDAKLLLYLIVVAQASDVLQYVFGKLFGRRKIAPNVSPNKTVEGFVGGVAAATLLGVALRGVTPFDAWQAAGMSLVITLMGFAGGLTMSAIKRDRGIKDFGSSIAGHGGVLDRIDSICFSAPVFFHLTRFFFS